MIRQNNIHIAFTTIIYLQLFFSRNSASVDTSTQSDNDYIGMDT